MSYLGLRTWDPVLSGKSQLPCSQELRLHGLTSSDLGLRTYGREFEPVGQALLKLGRCQSKETLQKQKKLGQNVLLSCLGQFDVHISVGL